MFVLRRNGVSPSEIDMMLRDTVLALNFEKDSFYQKNGKTFVRDLSGKGNDVRCEQARFSSDGPTQSSVVIDPKGSLQLPRRLIASGKPFTVAGWVNRKLSWDQGDPLVFAQKNKAATHELSCGLGIVDARVESQLRLVRRVHPPPLRRGCRKEPQVRPPRQLGLRRLDSRCDGHGFNAKRVREQHPLARQSVESWCLHHLVAQSARVRPGPVVGQQNEYVGARVFRVSAGSAGGSKPRHDRQCE